MSDTVGSIRKFTIEGIPYRVKADGDFSHVLSKFENSVIATSGEGMRKMEKRVPEVSSIVLVTNGAEGEELKAHANSVDWLKIAFTMAGGDIYRCSGAIEIESKGSMEGATNLKVMPKTDWTPFIA